MVAIHFMHYNFVRIHKTLHTTPAMAAVLSDKLWCFADIAVLIPDPIPVKRGSYKRKIKTECATVQNRNDLYGSINW